MDWLKDAFLVCIGWLLGLFTLPIAKDVETREKCLNSLYELKRLLEGLSKYTGYQSRNENGFYERLMQIKAVLERLDVEKTGLAFPCYMLNDLLAESFSIFKNLDPEHENLAFHIPQTVVALIHAWDDKNVYHPNFDNIGLIQKVISQSLPRRCISWLYSLTSQASTRLFRG
jgi:hypothetical protein